MPQGFWFSIIKLCLPLFGLILIYRIICVIVSNPNWIGRHGEKLVERELNLVKALGRGGQILRNVYIPKEDGTTSEIDVVYITQKGIFVIESKNYSGWIFGDENQGMWTASLPNKQKNRFYNPIKQNKTHVKWLSNFLGGNIPLYSIIVFSERCELKKVTVYSPEISVIKRNRLYATVRSMWDCTPDLLTDEQVGELTRRLDVCTNVDEVTKQMHVESINQRFKQKPNVPNPISAADTTNADVCPKCGAKLVRRVARQGQYAGQVFFGCSNYPKCRYMRKDNEH